MSGLETMTDEQFERCAIENLRRELGVDGLARFLRLDRSGPADDTKDRMQWRKDPTVEPIVDPIKRRRHG